MAALQPAVDRVKFIITGEGKRIASPATISGLNGKTVHSYEKIIGMETRDGSWRVNDAKDSMTTNRHVRALIQALDELDIPYEKGPLW